MKKLLAYLVDPEACIGMEYGVLDDLDCFYETLDCDTIDIVTRKIGGRVYDIICDDEALLKPFPCPSATGSNGTMLYNKLLVCGQADDEGELTSLTDEDIANLKAHTQTSMCVVYTAHSGGKVKRELLRLTDVEYC